MKHLFDQDELKINLFRRENKVVLSIYSMYSGSNRKSQLYVNEERLSTEVENLWKSVKTTKLNLIHVSFHEEDWYDDEVDVYETPIIYIKKGLRKSKVSFQNHGSVPKEWGIEVSCTFENLQTKKPILDVIRLVLGSYFTPQMEKDFVRQYNPTIKQIPQLVK